MASTGFRLVDAVLERFAGALGGDREGYTCHVARVLAFYRKIAHDHEAPEQVQIAGAFHDLGIWTARTFDYLAPSVRLARDYLTAEGREAASSPGQADHPGAPQAHAVSGAVLRDGGGVPAR